MSGTGRCYDNARMESFFATLKKEKLYKIQTEQIPIAQLKSIVFRYIVTYYNRIRIYTGNSDGLPPSMYRQAAKGLAAQSENLGCSILCTILDFPTFCSVKHAYSTL